MDLIMAAFLAIVFSLIISSGVSFSINPSKGTIKGERSSLVVRVQEVLSPRGIEETTTSSSTKVPTTNIKNGGASQSDSPIQSQSQLQSQKQIHLISLQWTPEDDAQKFSRIVRDTWRWKDAVLGDGRDFFVPKPRTLKALQSYLSSLRGGVDGNEGGASGGIEECVVLSNCARFEILLVTSIGVDPAPLISNMLLLQMESYRKRPIQINLPLDWAGAIDPHAAAAAATATATKTRDGHAVTSVTSDQAELVQYWTHVKGVRNITDHLCRVAAGMAPRPRRPNRETVFQPFSSRDSHIMLQLRRTLEIAQDATGATSLSILLRYALQAGKAARTPAKVPELRELRNYGTGNSKYCVQPPNEVSQRVTAVSTGACGCWMLDVG